jgi:hypothetical protein
MEQEESCAAGGSWIIWSSWRLKSLLLQLLLLLLLLLPNIGLCAPPWLLLLQVYL